MKSVRVVDTVYTIVVRRDVKDADGKPAFGNADTDKTTIEIDASSSKERQRWALIHELAHATFHETGMAHELAGACGSDKADLIEEDLVRRFVPALLAAMRNARLR